MPISPLSLHTPEKINDFLQKVVKDAPPECIYVHLIDNLVIGHDGETYYCYAENVRPEYPLYNNHPLATSLSLYFLNRKSLDPLPTYPFIDSDNQTSYSTDVPLSDVPLSKAPVIPNHALYDLITAIDQSKELTSSALPVRNENLETLLKEQLVELNAEALALLNFIKPLKGDYVYRLEQNSNLQRECAEIKHKAVNAGLLLTTAITILGILSTSLMLACSLFIGAPLLGFGMFLIVKNRHADKFDDQKIAQLRLTEAEVPLKGKITELNKVYERSILVRQNIKNITLFSAYTGNNNQEDLKLNSSKLKI